MYNARKFKYYMNIMKTVDIKFNVKREVLLSDVMRGKIMDHYRSIGSQRLTQLWNGSIPPREKLSIEVAGACVCFMDDWECTIFAGSYNGCIRALSAIHNVLVGKLKKQATFEPLLTDNGPGTLDELLTNEQRRRRTIKVVIWIGLTLAGWAIGYAMGLFVE